VHDDYGSFVGTLTLPAGANEDDITATYDKGIFLSVGVSEAATAEKHVTVRATN
jgi:HSP20 family molecular chaperone IbpA